MSEKGEAPNISPERFMEWLEGSKSVGEIVVKGRKILVNSPFESDEKFHCAIFPYGWKGKYHDKGRYKCFKSNKSGDLYSFVQEVEKCDFHKAVKLIGEKAGWNPGKRRNDANLADAPKKIESLEELSCDLRWPRGLVDLTEESTDPNIRKAASYIKKRGIDPVRFELLYCTEDHLTGHPNKRFKQYLEGRILIPYFGPNGHGIYWSARGTSSRHVPKYLEPHASDGPVDKQAVIYCRNWQRIRGKVVLIVEGALDAISLTIAGVPAIAVQGSQLFDMQASILRQMDVTPVYAFDRDKAGRLGVIKAQEVYRRQGFFLFAPPKEDDPEDKKGHDWNSLLVSWGPEKLKRYVLDQTEPLSDRALFTIKKSLA